MTSLPPAAPDTKDWTWVLERACPDCGFDSSEVTPASLPERLLDTTLRWREVLTRSDLANRPTPDVWSPLEYACHVRDMHRVFGERVLLMLDQDHVEFANWDQDAAAVVGEYAAQDTEVVREELTAAAEVARTAYAAAEGDQWGHRGLRSNGSEFTLLTLGRYHLHDAVHHLHDVAG